MKKRKLSYGWMIWFALVALACLRLFFIDVSPFMIDGEWHVYNNMLRRFLEWIATSVLLTLIWGGIPYGIAHGVASAKRRLSKATAKPQ